MTIRRVTSPDAPEPPPERWSNCLVVDGIAYVSGMVARGAAGLEKMDEYEQAKEIFRKIKALLEAMPDGFALDAWLALAAPTGAPNDIVERVYATLREALKDPTFRAALGGDGSEIVINSPQDFARQIADEADRGEALIKRVGVKLD